MNFLFIKNPRAAVSEFDVPTGGIVLWYGLATEVPTGWEIYTAASDVFILGASAGNMSTTVAGSLTHTHTNSATSTAAGHTHIANASAGSGNSTEVFGTSTNSVADDNHSHNANASVASAGSHAHSIADTGSASNLPNYHRLYWIRRI